MFSPTISTIYIIVERSLKKYQDLRFIPYILTKNDYNRNLYNGDIGIIKEIIGSKKGEICIDFDGSIVKYTQKDLQKIKHGYIISIHKSQGSEFDMVIMPVVNSFKRMLYNKLVYTGVTRAKKSLVIVGDSNAFIYGINNDYVDNRKTTLKDFIINFYNE